MGGGISADLKYAQKESDRDPNVFPSQHYERGQKSQKCWTDREITVGTDELFVHAVRSPKASPTAGEEERAPLLALSLHRDLSVTVDRTDESRQPVLVLRQESHVLCIKMKDDPQLDAFTMLLKERIMICDSSASHSHGQGLLKMFELFDEVTDNVDTEDANTMDALTAAPREVCGTTPPPKMNVVIMVVGTRGDVQPFVHLGQALQKYGHRVRLATHAEYRNDVLQKGGLEYYPLAGDPKKLSSYMVKTGGRLLPDLLNESERRDLPEKMQMLRDITRSTWPACTAPDPEDRDQKAFLADAIISNPVTYGHIHCAEALSVPLHIMFPQPWSPTKCFPHPLSNMDLSSSWSAKNWYSYKIVDEFMWLGLQFVINDFRREILQISPIRTGERGHNLLNDNKVPISHMWSPSVVPKCPDWPGYVDVVGEFRGNGETTEVEYTPDPAFQKFLDETKEAGLGKPVYVGFGSMVIEDGEALATLITEAAATVNCRVVLQSGWTKYAEDNTALSEHVFVVGSMPHDYLFGQVCAVVHHGGAGTTSAGLRAGNPTFICPFFGDQHFWAEMVHRSGAGPAGCPISKLTQLKFQQALEVLTAPSTQERAATLAVRMSTEDGLAVGVESFHRNLPVADLLCEVSIFNRESKLARVYCSDCGLKMCSEVDAVIHRSAGGREGHSRVPFRCMRWGVIAPESILDGLGQGVGAVAYEVAGGLYDLVTKPIQRGREAGAKGAAKGLAEGFSALVARPIRGGGILIDRVSKGAKHKKMNLGNSNTSHDVIRRHNISSKSKSEVMSSSQFSIALSSMTDVSSMAELTSMVPDDKSEFPDTIPEHYDEDEDDIVLNGKTLGELNMKRGGENGIKYFLKDIVKSHMKTASGNQQSVYNLVEHLKQQASAKSTEAAVEEKADGKKDGDSEGAANMKLVVSIEKAFERTLHFMIVWDRLDTSGDRMIGLSELEKLLPQSEASAVMRRADVNNDGELTFSELASQIMQYVEL